MGGPIHHPPHHSPHRPHIHMHSGPMWGWRRGPRRSVYGPGGGCASASVGFFSVIVLVLVLMLVGLAQTMTSYTAGIGGTGSASSGGVTRSTVKREPLPRGSVTETAYYTDELGWIGNATKLTAGLKNFYQRTGVQPYLYITDTINGSHTPTDADVKAFAEARYDELFSDEAHLLFIFFEYTPSQYHTWYMNGRQAKTVLDDEAMDILLDYVDLYYYQEDKYSDEEFFSLSFDEASKRIMTVTKSPWVSVMLVAGAVLVVWLLFSWWKKAKKQKNLEAEQTEKILNTSLESFGDRDAEERAKKYED